MAREDELATAFVEFADTLVDTYDITEFLQLVTYRCADLVGADAVGVLLGVEGEGLGVAAASTEDIQELELFQMQNDQGPCRDAFQGGQQVAEEDLDRAADRWPAFAARAQAAGFSAVHTFPMRLRGQVVGALNFFSKKPGSLTDSDTRMAQALADVATIGILHERAVRDAEALSGQLQLALDNRTVIEQAKGILMRSRQIDARAAFEALRRYARDRNVKVRDVAQALVDEVVPTDEFA